MNKFKKKAKDVCGILRHVNDLSKKLKLTI
jgi:hypothetical protein